MTDTKGILHPFQRAALLRANAINGHTILLAAKDQIYQVDVARRQWVASWRASWQVKDGGEPSYVILLATSPDGKYAAAVTGDNKTVHLLGTTDGLVYMKHWVLPKRPCTLAFTSDSGHILCGDKFGDVYALPITEDADAEPLRKKARKAKTTTPAATSLTVHTKGNLQALEFQRKLAEKAAKEGKAPEPSSSDLLEFPYDPVVGHVSMLTDLVATRIATEDTQSGPTPGAYRNFIITADRDEHIRVSRGLPQSHVIHGFCLGHQQFVNKICLLRSGLMVSGGGDDYLCIWKWQQSRLLTKVDLSECFVRQDTNGAASKFAVTGLWNCTTAAGPISFICASEGCPQLLYVRVSDGVVKMKTVLDLRGNPLDVVVLPTAASRKAIIVVCLDNVHVAGSITTARESENVGPRLQLFEVGEHGGSAPYEVEQEWVRELDASFTPQAVVESAQLLTSQLSKSLYGVENLRKRGGEEAESSTV